MLIWFSAPLASSFGLSSLGPLDHRSCRHVHGKHYVQRGKSKLGSPKLYTTTAGERIEYAK